MARRATMIVQERENQPFVLLLDGGNTWVSDQFQTLTQESNGALVVEAMNLMGYDAMVLGERDLQLGVDLLRQRMDEADFAVLSANVWLAETGERFARPFTTLEIDGRSVGIIGLTGTDADVPPAFTISDPIAATEEILLDLAEQTDLIIILSHLAWSKNKQLAELAPEIDLIISGGMEKPDLQLYEANSTGVYLAQAELPSERHAGRFVGRWRLDLDTEGRAIVKGWATIALDPGYVDDPELIALLQRYRDRYW